MNRYIKIIHKTALAFCISMALCSAPNVLIAQDIKVVKDLELWGGAEIEKSIGKAWKISFKEELRLKTDASEINNFFSQLGVDYKITKNFNLEANYRYIKNRNKSGIYENHSRYNLGIKYQVKFQDFTFKYRLRYQKEVESLNILDLNETYEKNIRNRALLEYTYFKDFKPFVSLELFQLHLPYEYPDYNIIRYKAGLKYDAGSIGTFKVAYAIERELENILPYTHFIFSINYSYDI